MKSIDMMGELKPGSLSPPQVLRRPDEPGLLRMTVTVSGGIIPGDWRAGRYVGARAEGDSSATSVMLSAAKHLGRGVFLAKQYYVYMMASYRGNLYTGVTSDLTRRVYEHQQKLAEGFTKKYNVSKLVYFETTEDISSAIAREKQIKGWVRRRKADLIDSVNPYWKDLAETWYEDTSGPQTLRPDHIVAQSDNLSGMPQEHRGAT